jgi:hypothetical protein
MARNKKKKEKSDGEAAPHPPFLTQTQMETKNKVWCQHKLGETA